MKKRILVLALVFSVVLSALCAPTVGAAGKTAMPKEYAPVIETYYSIIYGNWYVPLTAEDLVNMGACPLLAEFDWDEKRSFGCYLEDINGDGTPELFLGVDNTEFNDQVYQLFTVNKGQLSCLYTATGEDAVYLLKDGLLEYELWGSDDSYAMCVYRLAKNGGVSVTEGVLYDKTRRRGRTSPFRTTASTPRRGRRSAKESTIRSWKRLRRKKSTCATIRSSTGTRLPPGPAAAAGRRPPAARPKRAAPIRGSIPARPRVCIIPIRRRWTIPLAPKRPTSLSRTGGGWSTVSTGTSSTRRARASRPWRSAARTARPSSSCSATSSFMICTRTARTSPRGWI